MSQGQVSSALPGQGCQWCRPKRFPCSRSTLSPNDAHRATYCPSRSCLRGRHIHTGWCRSWAGVARVESVHDFETGRHKGVPYGPRRDHACVPGTVHEFGPTYLLLLRARPRGTRAGGGRHSPVGATLVVARQACAAVARARFVREVETGRHKGVPYREGRAVRRSSRNTCPEATQLSSASRSYFVAKAVLTAWCSGSSWTRTATSS